MATMQQASPAGAPGGPFKSFRVSPGGTIVSLMGRPLKPETDPDWEARLAARTKPSASAMRALLTVRKLPTRHCLGRTHRIDYRLNAIIFRLLRNRSGRPNISIITSIIGPAQISKKI